MINNMLDIQSFPLIHRIFIDFLRFGIRLFKGGKNITKFYKVFSTQTKSYFIRMKANIKEHTIVISIVDNTKKDSKSLAFYKIYSKDIEPFLFTRKVRMDKKTVVGSFAWRTGFHGVIDGLFDNFYVSVTGILKGAVHDILLEERSLDYKLVEISVWLKENIEEEDN